ncbi:MAG: GumC family protein [Maritimibacter sp.]
MSDATNARLALAGSQSQAEDDINLIAVAGILWRGAPWIAAATALFGLFGVYLVLWHLEPRYTANAKVAFENRQETLINLDSVVSGISGDQTSINTEVEILRSRELIGKLVDRLDLQNEPRLNPYLDSPQEVAPEREREVLINNVLSAIRVGNLRSSFVFSISAVSGDPKLSQRLANGLADLYIDDQLEVKFEATAKASAWLGERVGTLRIELEEAQEAVKTFTATTGIVTPEEVAAVNRQVDEARERLQDARTREMDLKSKLVALEEAQATGDPLKMAAALGDASLITLAQNGADRDTFMSRLNAQAARATLEANRAAQQASGLESSLSTLEERYDQKSRALVTLEQLSREADASKAIYEYFLTRLKETSVQEGIQQAESRVLSYAPLPTIQSFPKKKRTVAFYLLIGAILGSVGVLLREFLRNGYRDATELEADFAIPVLGQVPLIPASERKDVLTYLQDKPTSAAAEAVRNLRTSLLLSNIDTPAKVILSTSCGPSEGKTTNALALAQNFAGLGHKVLLVEGDTRRPMFSQYFASDLTPGSLLNVLTGEADFRDEVRSIASIGIDFLGGGQIKANAADVFSSERFEGLMKEARDAYDIIIIDTPPVLLVPDARVIAAQADAVLFTVKWNDTSKAQIKEALRLFDIADQKVSGFVLSQIDPKRMGKYGYGGRYGAYGYHGDEYYSS